MSYTRALLALVGLALPAGLLAHGEHRHDHKQDHAKHEHAEHDHSHDEHRQYGAHVHGIGKLNIVLDGDEVHIELDSPAANIVGFEHQPRSAEDRAALERAARTLRDGDRLFLFSRDAGCRQEKATVESDMLEAADKKQRGYEHGSEKMEHDDHAHADIRVEYRFECSRPDRVEQLVVELFEAFPGTERLDVQYVIGSRQGAAELNSARHVLRF
jgi:ABC-type Zn2+ transport system substrate-binding protein/surface adhesin